MKPLYTEEDFLKSKTYDLLPCQCYHCDSVFYLPKRRIQDALNEKTTTKGKYCSRKCASLNHRERVIINCTNCGKSIEKWPNDIKRFKNSFCSSSCAATYNNTHKTKGYRRSKLEIYLEKELKLLYPNLQMDFNKTDAINSELDIFIPSLSLAFELNGLFHYEPIYGRDKLDKIQTNDDRKFQACIDKGIELCIIDTSEQKYFKERTSEKYFNIINTIINKKLC
jgi:hypothetical protein